jgi:hypothetical protein
MVCLMSNERIGYQAHIEKRLLEEVTTKEIPEDFEPGRAKSFGQSCNRMEKLPIATDNVL